MEQAYLMVVVKPPVKPGGAFERGICVGCETTTKGVPFITVVDNDPVGLPCTWMLVEPGTSINGVLLMIVKLPVSPGGAFDRAILVEEGKITKLVPPMLVVLNAGPLVGDGAAKVVGPTSKKGVLLIIVVGALLSWLGAFTTGIRVEDPIIMTKEPPEDETLAPEMTSGVGAELGLKFVGEVMINTGVPSIFEVWPERPEGAADSGIVVGGMNILTPVGLGLCPWTCVSGEVSVGQPPII